MYRGTNLPEDLIIISAKLQGTIGKKVEIEKQNYLINKKKLSQPSQIKHVVALLKILVTIRKHGC